MFILPNINLELKSTLRTKYLFYQSLLYTCFTFRADKSTAVRFCSFAILCGAWWSKAWELCLLCHFCSCLLQVQVFLSTTYLYRHRDRHNRHRHNGHRDHSSHCSIKWEGGRGISLLTNRLKASVSSLSSSSSSVP